MRKDYREDCDKDLNYPPILTNGFLEYEIELLKIKIKL